MCFFWECPCWGFPGGPVVKNPPANAGDMGSIPGSGRSHVMQGNWARVPQVLSLCSGAHKSQLLKPTHPRAHAPQQEKSAHHDERKPTCSSEDPAQPKTIPKYRKENALAYIYQNPTYPSPFLILIMYYFVLSTSYEYGCTNWLHY